MEKTALPGRSLVQCSDFCCKLINTFYSEALVLTMFTQCQISPFFFPVTAETFNFVSARCDILVDGR